MVLLIALIVLRIASVWRRHDGYSLCSGWYGLHPTLLFSVFSLCAMNTTVGFGFGNNIVGVDVIEQCTMTGVDDIVMLLQ